MNEADRSQLQHYYYMIWMVGHTLELDRRTSRGKALLYISPTLISLVRKLDKVKVDACRLLNNDEGWG